jgi:ParB/RepB/Spo0J family partition protein
MTRRDIPAAQLVVSPLNSRKNLQAGEEDSSLTELAESIKQRGLINVITVRAIRDGKFEIVAGQRRFAACRHIGLDPIPCEVRDDLSDDSAQSLSLIENVQRADLHPLDKARALKALLDQYGSYEKVSKEVAWSIQTIRKYIQLLSLPTELQARLGTKDGPAGIGSLARLAATFEGQSAIEAYDKISGFRSNIQEKILQQSEGDLSRLDELAEEAKEGVFDIRHCGGRVGCEIVRDIIEGEITQSEFEELVRNVRVGLGLNSMPRQQRVATRDFWKALAKS